MDFPLSSDDALTHLRDALGGNYAAATDDTTLERALQVDAVTVGPEQHLRPWATAARLIRWNTEYELDYKLKARIDRKLGQLDAQQAQADTQAGITEAVAVQLGSSGSAAGVPASGPVDTRAVF